MWIEGYGMKKLPFNIKSFQILPIKFMTIIIIIKSKMSMLPLKVCTFFHTLEQISLKEIIDSNATVTHTFHIILYVMEKMTALAQRK